MVNDDVFAVIAEATRRDILASLKAGDKAVGQLVEELGASQPTVSKHLRVLREASLVTMRAEGQKRFYALTPDPLRLVRSWLAEFDGGAGANEPAVPMAVDGTRSASDGLRTEALTPAGQQTSAQHRVPVREPRWRGEPELAPDREPERAPDRGRERTPDQAPALPAAVTLPVVLGSDTVLGTDGTRPQQLGRTVGRAAYKAADLLANLPKFGRRKD
ncbi:metalloregulator ArsR/SmtB family transcription factor [Paenarthrobacter sp. PH39-S1]|uniref:ArsR/SmtB family transcription factor n=1 Tax=Paenarthrobacter sp. PH39-S1 TaxID=3046204 RepID=UPI0024BB7018|nr:metalloregulator ArsR/SmtB family transcription factor [Paenarthrobacter sp. PH39-S1]MDJ0355144.1 metalloregulator ArsR/SmtB family transcription factor [Paenarthrobacter sp. PH39-S1]